MPRCKCEGCKARGKIISSAYAEAVNNALKWIRREHPKVWSEFFLEAQKKRNIVPHQSGRPKKNGRVNHEI